MTDKPRHPERVNCLTQGLRQKKQKMLKQVQHDTIGRNVILNLFQGLMQKLQEMTRHSKIRVKK